VLFVASSMHLPVVMTVANRALSTPINIWGDHSDAMAVRDSGWIQIFVENGQEAVDNTICAFRMGEDNRILLPVMVHLDGFALTHMIEPILFPEANEVERFLPPYNPPVSLNPAKPVTMGALGPPNIYTEAKYAQDVKLRESKQVILEVWREFGKAFGRSYNPVEKHHSDGARTLLMTMGSFSETAMVAVDKMKAEGKDIGLIKLRLWRPFPFEELREAVQDADVLIVLDRAISFGGPGGPVFSEIRTALYGLDKKPKVIGFVGGLGGRDISTGGFEEMVDKGIEIARTGSVKEYEMFGVRE